MFTLLVTTDQYQYSVQSEKYQTVESAMWDIIAGWESRGHEYDNRQGAYVSFLWGFWVTVQLVREYNGIWIRSERPTCHIRDTATDHALSLTIDDLMPNI